MRTCITANAANWTGACVHMIDMFISASSADVIQLTDPGMRNISSANRTFFAEYLRAGINECMRDFHAARFAGVFFIVNGRPGRCMCARIPASLAHTVCVFMSQRSVADRTFPASVLRSDDFQLVWEFQIADLACVILAPLAAESIRMTALPSRAADCALAWNIPRILMFLMLLVAFLAKPRMIPRPAVLMRPGEQSKFIRFHMRLLRTVCCCPTAQDR